MPGGCKSILNVKCLHKSYIAELFGPRVFCFSVGQNFKKILKKKRGGAIKVGIEVTCFFCDVVSP